MPKEINPWAMYPRKTSTAPLPEALINIGIEVAKGAEENSPQQAIAIYQR